ncbi:MAG: RNA polymerase factor sigma-54 [Terriglobales bacterium]
MVSLQPRLNLKVTQKQILTPGLVQMVSVLALNKLELRDMITAEMVENPVLEELDDSVPLLDETARKEEERVTGSDEPVVAGEKTDSFEEIDFGQFFKEYLDPGFRSPEIEAVEKPSFENFLSRPSTLTDHLMWQLGAMSVRPDVAEAAQLVIGNLDEDGYLTATDEELLDAAYVPAGSGDRANGTGSVVPQTAGTVVPFPSAESALAAELATAAVPGAAEVFVATGEQRDAVAAVALENLSACGQGTPLLAAPAPQEPRIITPPPKSNRRALFDLRALHEAIELVRQMDPIGVAARDLRECLLAQLKYHQQMHEKQKEKTGQNGATSQVLADAIAIVSDHLKLVQNKQIKELAKTIGRPQEAVVAAMDFLKTLDPRPGRRYNKVEPRLIEPDVAFIKQGDEYIAILNDDDVPQLRLNPTYRRLLNRDAAEKEVRTYIKEKYKSAIQLIKNIEQRKQTILKVCYAIIGRQREFLDHGIDHLKPMMIKEVAEEIGVHPSTVSRAVSNKYVHTPQGVFELRYFFSESVNGPEGGATSLLILKRRVKKLIEEEDPARPYTDEQITRILQSQGIQVTRRTVAKYREDMRIPSTHQRRVKT